LLGVEVQRKAEPKGKKIVETFIHLKDTGLRGGGVGGNIHVKQKQG